MREFDFVIVGGGVTGVALARALAGRGKRRIAVLEKEPRVAAHASGRNSGVLHAGYNPRPGTLKARLCVEGNRLAKEFCHGRGVAVVEGGILIVALDDAEARRLEELHARGTANGVPGLELLDGSGLRAVEPNAAGIAALRAPSGASVDAVGYVESLAGDARDRGVEIVTGHRVVRIERGGGGFEIAAQRVAGPRSGAGGAPAEERVRAAVLVNCAGLFADRLAHALDAGRDYSLVPIRGEYRRAAAARADLVRSMVYPVPDLEFPFLGVHWTRTFRGELLVGPNAVPALGREAYRWRESSIAGALETASHPQSWRLLRDARVRRLFADQVAVSLRPSLFARRAAALVPSIGPADLLPGPSGIRAQLVDRQGRMVEDLLVESRDGAHHVLNVVSPGLTCSLPFADLLAERVALES